MENTRTLMQLSQVRVPQKLGYMPLGVRIKQEWLNRKRAELDIISGKVNDVINEVQKSVDTTHCQVGRKQRTVKLETKDESNQTKAACTPSVLNIPTERDDSNFDNTDFLQCGSSPSFSTNKYGEISIRKFPEKSRNIPSGDNAQNNSMADDVEPKPQKSRHILHRKGREISSNTKMKSRSHIKDDLCLQRKNSKQIKRSASRPKSNGRKLSVSKINKSHKSWGSVTGLPHSKGNRRKKRIQNKAVNKPNNGNSPAARLNSKIRKNPGFDDVKRYSIKDQETVSKKAHRSQERHRKQKRVNNPRIPTDMEMIRYSVLTKNANKTKTVPKVNKLEQKGTRKPQTSLKTTLPASKRAKRKRSGTSQIVHKNTQTSFDDGSNLRYDSEEILSAVEVARIGDILKTANKRHRKASLSRKRSTGRPVKQQHEIQSLSAPDETPDITKETGDVSSLDIMQDYLDGESGRTPSLLERLQRTLSFVKGKKNLSFSEIGFKNHQPYPVNSVYRHNSLPKTLQQLGTPCTKKPLQSRSAGELKSLPPDIKGRKPKGNKKKREKNTNRKKRSISCLPRTGIGEGKPLRKFTRKRSYKQMKR